MLHRRMSLVALVPLVVVLLALTGCSTEPATGITSTSAYLNGEGNCPGAGHSFTWYYNLWDSQGNVQNGPQYYANCASGPTASVALPSIQFGNLLTGALHCFAIHVWYQTPFQEFMHFDADGTKNGYHFDCFTTKFVQPPEVMPPPSSNEATAAGAPTSTMYSNTRIRAKLFWQGEGQWGSCMENNVRQMSAPPDQLQAAMSNNNELVFTTFKLLSEQSGGGTVGALAIGCSSSRFDEAHNPGDSRIVYNSGVGWGLKKHCVAGTHEWGHLRGFTHTSSYRIMQYPPFSGFPICQ